MALVEQFRADEWRQAFVRIAGVLDEHAQALDLLGGELEGGAGTDLTVVLRAALDAADPGADLVSLTAAMARGARAVSPAATGLLLTQLFGALAEVSTSADVIDGQRFAMALELCAEQLQESSPAADAGGPTAVVSAASVGALNAADQSLDLADVIIAAANEGLDELESGIAVNPRLAEHGVVDASAAGFLLVLDSLAAIVTGDPLPEAPTGSDPDGPVGGESLLIKCVIVPSVSGRGGTARAGESWIESCAFIESVWHGLGTILVFEIRGETCVAELETTDAGRAIETLCEVGRPTELSITPTGRTKAVGQAVVRPTEDRHLVTPR